MFKLVNKKRFAITYGPNLVNMFVRLLGVNGTFSTNTLYRVGKYIT